jgi:hypothetical protein
MWADSSVLAIAGTQVFQSPPVMSGITLSQYPLALSRLVVMTG